MQKRASPAPGSGEIRTIVDYVVDMVQAPEFVSNVHHTGWLDARIAAQVGSLGDMGCAKQGWGQASRRGVTIEQLLAYQRGGAQHPAVQIRRAGGNHARLPGPCAFTAQVRSERPPWHLSVICGTVLRALGRVSSRSAEYLSYLEKGQLPPARISLTSLREEFVVDGACACSCCAGHARPDSPWVGCRQTVFCRRHMCTACMVVSSSHSPTTRPPTLLCSLPAAPQASSTR